MNKDHLKDVRLNSDYKYQYMGDYYTWELPEGVSRRMLLAVGGGVLFEIICGCIPNSGADGHPWVMIPFIVAMIMAVVLLWRTIQLYAFRKGMKEYQKKQIENWFPAASFFLGIGSVAAAIAAMVSGGVASMFPWCQFMAGAGGFSAYQLFKIITWKKVSSTSDENN
ncbi:MAG: hypothetical protein K6G04_04560 [Lachnospiraceae bacterium]|nr:hypothetical protein [Lachnospiraceae bacterium]